MLTSPHVYAAIAAQRQADLRTEMAARRLARGVLSRRRAERRERRGALRAARLEAGIEAASRPTAVRPAPVAR